MKVTEKRPAVLTGPFAHLLYSFINHKHALGYKYTSASQVLTIFDNFSKAFNIQNYVLTKEVVTKIPFLCC